MDVFALLAFYSGKGLMSTIIKKAKFQNKFKFSM
jgi:hypothetical protein